jgi:hypothetical protein
MSFPQFGEIVEEKTPKLEEFGEIVGEEEKLLPKYFQDNRYLKRIPRIFGQQVLKGGLGTYGDILDLLRAQPKERLLPGQEALAKAETKVPESVLPFLQEEDIAPQYARLPSGEEIGKIIGELTPETAPERFAKRAGRALGGGAAFGVGGAPLAGLAAASVPGQMVVELGAPEWVGDIVEIASFLGPAAFKKGLVPRADQEKFVNYARSQGLTDSEITGLLQGEKKLATLSKLAKKTGKAEKQIAQIESKLGDAYQGIKQEASKFGHLSGEQSGKLADEFGGVLKDLRTTIKAAPDKAMATKFIEDAIENLINRGTTPEELVNFYQDINASVNWNAIKGGKKQLAALKEPIIEALRKTSPELAEDFTLTNELYSKFKNFSKALKPHQIDKILDLGELGSFLYGLGTMNPAALKGFAIGEGGRHLMRELLINPRFQSMSRKILSSLKSNNIAQASQIARTFKDFTRKKFPDIYENIDWENLDI